VSIYKSHSGLLIAIERRKYMRKVIVICMALAFAVATAGCAPKFTLNKAQYENIKTVAVVEYTVPSRIEFRKDPTKKSGGKITLTDVAKAALKMLVGDGTKAATEAHKSFIETLNKEGLTFVTISPEEMYANPDFTALHKPAAMPVADDDGSVMGKFGSMIKKQMAADPGKSPKMLNSYGLTPNWSAGTALNGKGVETKYLLDSIKALRVDAVIVVNDPGFSFSCEFCGGGTGAASTGSAYIVTMVGRNGEVILEIKEWFATTDEQAALVAGVVNPLEQNDLYREHGRKTARVFAKFLKEALAGKK